MNTYVKYCPNVFVAKCTEKHERGSVIPVTTKYGKENNSIVFNLVFERDGLYYYSIIREDGYNMQERSKLKSEKYLQWAKTNERKSTEAYNKSNEHRDFLSLGEPIKVGHHSEKRHRKIIEQANNNMRKCVELSDKVSEQESKSKYWESRANEINLSMPESIDFYAHKYEQAKKAHEDLKSGKTERSHSYSLTYAKKNLKNAEANFKLAQKLWSE